MRVSQTSTIPPVLVGKEKKNQGRKKNRNEQTLSRRMGKKTGQPTNPFEAAVTVEVFVPKEIIARRIQAIFAGPNKDKKAEHYLVVWKGYPLKKVFRTGFLDTTINNCQTG